MWHPESWSEQARNMCNKQVERVIAGRACIEQARCFFIMSYRHQRIRYRAAKRFGRLIRAGKVRETSESVTAWTEAKKKSIFPETQI